MFSPMYLADNTLHNLYISSQNNTTQKMASMKVSSAAKELAPMFHTCHQLETQQKANQESSDSEDEQPQISGGHDYKFVRKLKKIEDDDLVCPICQLVCRDPQQSQCCGKIFCQICVTRLKKTNELSAQCPNCRQCPFEVFADKRSKRSIANLNVFCTRQEKGCDWEGTVDQAETHSTSECSHRVVKCSNSCGKKLRHYELDKHNTTYCPKRLIECCHCHEKGQWDYITGKHEMKCPEKLIQCNNKGCARNIKRGEMDHHQSICPKLLVNCSFQDLGCTAICQRERMKEHNDQHISFHLTMAANIARCNIEVPKMDHLLQVAPVTLTIPNVSQSSDLKTQPFLAFTHGYKMCIRIDKAISAFSVCAMDGKYDNSLVWPFHCTVNIFLLNQLEDANHHKMSRLITIQDDYYLYITIGFFTKGKIKKDKLAALKQSGYLINDTLYLAIEVNKASTTKNKQKQTRVHICESRQWQKK